MRQRTTVFWPGHGFYARLGTRTEDWELVQHPEDYGIDEYEIQQMKDRTGR